MLTTTTWIYFRDRIQARRSCPPTFLLLQGLEVISSSSNTPWLPPASRSALPRVSQKCMRRACPCGRSARGAFADTASPLPLSSTVSRPNPASFRPTRSRDAPAIDGAFAACYVSLVCLTAWNLCFFAILRSRVPRHISTSSRPHLVAVSQPPPTICHLL